MTKETQETGCFKWWWAVLLGFFTIVQGVASIEIAWDVVQRRVPPIFRLLNPIVSFWNTPITISLWILVVGVLILLILPRYVSRIFSSANNRNENAPKLSKLFDTPARFRNVWIDWYEVSKSGRGVTPPTSEIKYKNPLRCAEDNCNQPITTTAQIDGAKFLVCKNGHFVGNEEGYEFWRRKFDERFESMKKDRDERLRKIKQEAAAKLSAMEEKLANGEMTEDELEKWKWNAPPLPMELQGELVQPENDSYFLSRFPIDSANIIADFLKDFQEAQQLEVFQNRIQNTVVE